MNYVLVTCITFKITFHNVFMKYLLFHEEENLREREIQLHMFLFDCIWVIDYVCTVAVVYAFLYTAKSESWLT